LFLIRCLWDLTVERLAVICVNVLGTHEWGLLEYLYGTIAMRSDGEEKRSEVLLADIAFDITLKAFREDERRERQNNLVMHNDKLLHCLAPGSVVSLARPKSISNKCTQIAQVNIKKSFHCFPRLHINFRRISSPGIKSQ
jgi:hypothetical protein